MGGWLAAWAGGWVGFQVTNVTSEEAIQNNYGTDEDGGGGGEGGGGGGGGGVVKRVAALQRRFSSAYMLVYVRRSQAAALLRPLTEADLPEHLKERFRAETGDKVPLDVYEWVSVCVYLCVCVCCDFVL